MSKWTTAKNINGFADLVKVSTKIISFDFGTTNMMKLPHKKFYLSTTILSARSKIHRGGAYRPPPRTFKCQINAIFPFMIFTIELLTIASCQEKLFLLPGDNSLALGKVVFPKSHQSFCRHFRW